ncbi:MAG: hypothetical protein GF308_20435 [Candidatus Heimdallarchaeota archaeon]|nr:hypothetical protein [Candidatus Heimdallarchaeota archaeon]
MPLEQRAGSSLYYSPENSQLTPKNLGAPNYRYLDIYVENELAYLYDYDGQIDVYDVSKPKKTQRVDSIEYWNYPGIFSIHNNSILTFNYTINDQRNITGFKLLKYDFEGELQVSSQCQFNKCFPGDIESQIVIENKTLFVLLTEELVNATRSQEEITTYLLTIDITDYSNPEIIGFNELFHYEASSISYNLRFYFDSTNRLALCFDINYLESFTEVLIFDLTTLTNPEEIARWTLNDKYPRALAVREDTLFILDRDEGLEIYGLSDLEAFVKIAEYQEKGQNIYNELIISGNKLYLICAGKIRVLDITNLKNIKKKGQYTPRLQGNGGFGDACIVDEILYLTRTSEFEDRRFFIIDCSNPNFPKKLYPSGIRLGAEDEIMLVFISTCLGILLVVGIIVGGIVFVIKRINRKRKQQQTKKQEEPTEEIAEGC